jgi:hypothetical protein
MRNVLFAGLAAALMLACAPSASAWTWPVDGPVLRPFVFGNDPYAGGQHRGIDIGASPDAPALAPASGQVTFAGSVPRYGKTVTIHTADGYAVTLLHLGALGVSRGASVEEGQPIAQVAIAGDDEHPEPYVYLGIRGWTDEHGYVDPLLFLPPRTSAPAPPAATPVPPVAAPAPPVAAPAPTPTPAASAPAAAVAAPVAAVVPAEASAASPAAAAETAARPARGDDAVAETVRGRVAGRSADVPAVRLTTRDTVQIDARAHARARTAAAPRSRAAGGRPVLAPARTSQLPERAVDGGRRWSGSARVRQAASSPAAAQRFRGTVDMPPKEAAPTRVRGDRPFWLLGLLAAGLTAAVWAVGARRRRGGPGADAVAFSPVGPCPLARRHPPSGRPCSARHVGITTACHRRARRATVRAGPRRIPRRPLVLASR